MLQVPRTRHFLRTRKLSQMKWIRKIISTLFEVKSYIQKSFPSVPIWWQVRGPKQMFFPTQIWACSKSLWQATSRQQLGTSYKLDQENWQTLSGRCGHNPNNISFFPRTLSRWEFLEGFSGLILVNISQGRGILMFIFSLISISWISI